MKQANEEKYDVIQDITLLYELSLAIGKSLDLRTNILNFIRVLQSRKNLNYISVWIKNRYLNFDLSLPNTSLIAGIPEFLNKSVSIPNDHKIYQLLKNSRYITINTSDSSFSEISTERDCTTGCFTIFKLGNIGFLKLYRAQNMNSENDRKLEQIIKKFTISIEGSLFHAKSIHEYKIRQKTEVQLRKKDNLYKTLVEGLDEGIVIIDNKLTITYANPQFLKKTGYALEDLLGKNPIENFFQKDDQADISKQRKKLLKGEKTTFEVRLLKKDGSFIWTYVIGTPLFGDDKEYLGSVNVLLDITQRKQMEEILIESEERTKLIIDSALDAVIIIDMEGLVTHWNQQAEEIFGWTKEEAVGSELKNLIIPKEYKSSHHERIKNYIKTGHGPVLDQRIEITGQRKNGETFPVELTIQSLKHKNKVFFSAFVRDITVPKKAKEDLETTYKRLETLIKSLQSGVLLEDENRKIIITNQKYCNIFKISAKPESLIGMDCTNSAKQSSSLLKNPEKFISSITNLLTEKKAKTNERVEFTDGKIFERNYIPIFSNEKYFGHLWQYKDITDKIKYEDELKIAKHTAEEASISKSRFLANTSHEIRTPLNAIYGFSKLLDETKKSGEQDKYITGIKNSALNLLSVVNDVLDFSKIESGEINLDLNPCCLHDVVNRLFQTLEIRAKKKDIQFSFEIDPNIHPYILADSSKLNQIFLNLLANAIKFTSQGWVKFECLLNKDSTKKTTIQFIVSDTGIGIDQKNQKSIFENFKQEDETTTRKFGGTGLGLPISKQLIELMDGELEIESIKNLGSRFFFSLEFEKAKESDLKIEEFKFKIDENLLAKKNILLVEDNEFNQIIAISMLEKWNITVDTANNGKEAIEKVKNNIYDLILMDKQMPIMDGLQATKTIRTQLKSKVPIIALTANVIKGVIATCLHAGMNDYISKPFEPEILFHKIASVLQLEKSITENLSSELPKTKIDTKQQLLDLSKLSEMMNNEQELVQRMLAKFNKLTPDFIQELNECFNSKKWEELSRTAHKIKPSINLLGIDALYSDFQQLEDNALLDDKIHLIPKTMNKINKLMPVVFEQIENELKEQ